MSVIEKLLVVQGHDCKIRQMEQEKQDIPARKENEQTRMEAHRKALGEAEDQLKARQAEVKQFDLDIESQREKIAKLRQQQLEIKTNKEFKAIEDEVKALERKISEIEDKELVLMEDVDGAKLSVEQKKADLKEEEVAVQSDIKMLDERLSGIEERLQGEQTAREAATVGIDPEWLARYQLIIDRRDLAVVEVQNAICGGCHMKVPPQIMHNAKKNLAMVCCDECGRLLY